ncbi:MAG: methyltransferase [Caulobacteraceae bacterium]|nr:methyltransferase [Caulobacteraceae bacterium]
MTGVDWTSGYVSDVAYTFGYYAELNPLRARLAFHQSWLAFPEIRTACELGFGQGLSVNIHAAASGVEWHGTDFNPSQAAFAQELAGAADSRASLRDDSFFEFSQRQDLPDFDFIGIHGIWSWISDENRALLADFVRRKLRPGGVLYISYNTLPGWSTFAPMRHLLTQHEGVVGANGGGIVERINGALDFAERLIGVDPLYARANPQVADRLKRLRLQDRNYLAHEYFNRDWHPMHFSAMAEWLTPAKLTYACSAHPLDLVNAVNLSQEQQALLAEFPDPLFRETIRDFMVNQQFRRDYWVKGPRKLSPIEQHEAVHAEKVVLVTPRADISLQVAGALGEATMSSEVYHPILDALADHKPRTLGQIHQAVASSLNIAQIMEAALVLSSAGHLAPVQDEKTIQKAKPKTARLNGYIQSRARGSGDINFLASPVTGGGVPVPRVGQLFLMAQTLGARTPSEWAAFAWQIFSAQGQKLIKDNVVLESADDNLAELRNQAELFSTKTFPALKGLGVA